MFGDGGREWSPPHEMKKEEYIEMGEKSRSEFMEKMDFVERKKN